MTDRALRILFPDATNRGHSVEVEFQLNTKRYRVFFRSADAFLSGNCDSFLACAILPCMKAGGGKLIARGEVSQGLISALSAIQDIYCSWDPSLRRTKIENVRPVPATSPTARRVGAFFSGGVDSFYTFLMHRDEITDLIFVHGLDIRLDNTSLRETASKTIREVASHFGKNVVEIETNIRHFLDPYVDWGKLGHGAALAAIGHLLSPDFRRIFVAATYTYAQLHPWGTHPVLDSLWSSETLEFVHDGCEATRVQKVALISEYEIALQSLRVCWDERNTSYNCGRCEKCLRTMINLKANGALSRCTTFTTKLDVERLSQVRASDNTRVYFAENLDALERSQGDEELVRALRDILDGSQPVPQEPRASLGRIIGKLMKRFT